MNTKQIIRIEIIVYPDPSPYVDVDVYINHTHEPRLSKGLEIDENNPNKWDTVVAAKNHAHDLISNWRPDLGEAQ